MIPLLESNQVATVGRHVTKLQKMATFKRQWGRVIVGRHAEMPQRVGALYKRLWGPATPSSRANIWLSLVVTSAQGLRTRVTHMRHVKEQPQPRHTVSTRFRIHATQTLLALMLLYLEILRRRVSLGVATQEMLPSTLKEYVILRTTLLLILHALLNVDSLMINKNDQSCFSHSESSDRLRILPNYMQEFLNVILCYLLRGYRGMSQICTELRLLFVK